MTTTTLPLHNELWPLILRHLDTGRGQQPFYQCTLVSKQFHLVANPILWKTIFFSINEDSARRFCNIIATLSSQRLAILGHHIEYLYLWNETWTDDDLLRLLPHIPRLKHLRFGFHSWNITEKSFQQLPSYCQQLTTLELSRASLTQVSFSAIGRYCHQLWELHLQLWDPQLLEWLELLTQCPLRSLTLFVDDETHYSTTATMAIQSFGQLTSLSIADCTSSPTTASLLTHLPTPTQSADHWPQIEVLIINNYNTKDEFALIEFIQSHPTLQSLALEGDFPTSDATLDAMAVWLEHAVALSLESKTTSTISPDGVLRLIHACPHLRRIDIVNCSDTLCDRFPKLVNYYDVNDICLPQQRIERIRQGKENNNNNSNNSNNSNNNRD